MDNVMVKFLNKGPYDPSNSLRGECYSYRNAVHARLGDLVVVDTKYGLAIAEVVSESSGYNASCNVVAVVDSSILRKRREDAIRAERIVQIKDDVASILSDKCLAARAIAGEDHPAREKMYSLLYDLRELGGIL